ncbi:MAG: hypothetical protein QM775_10775 [Pirellulales bacterium]
MRTPADLAALGARLEDARLLPTDAVIIYLQAEGLAVDDKAYLLCENFTAANPEAGRVAVEQIFEALGRSAAGTKLLLLDPGGRDYDPRLGSIVSEFLPLVRTAIESSGDEGLYVITAYSVFERSHLLHGLRQTIFGHFAARALAGEADENGDRSLDVGELFRYLQTNVAVWTDEATAGYSHQTPQLIVGTAETERRGVYPTVLPVPLNFTLADLEKLVAAPTATASGTAPPAVAAAPTASPTSTRPAAPQPTSTTPPPTAATAAAGQGSAAPPGSATPSSPAAQPPKKSETALALAAAVAEASRVPPPPAVVVPPPPGPEATVEKLVELNRTYLAAASRRPFGARPLDFAPHLWGAVQMHSGTYELRLAERPDDRKRIEPNLRRFSTALAEFTAGRVPSGNVDLLKQAGVFAHRLRSTKDNSALGARRTLSRRRRSDRRRRVRRLGRDARRGFCRNRPSETRRRRQALAGTSRALRRICRRRATRIAHRSAVGARSLGLLVSPASRTGRRRDRGRSTADRRSHPVRRSPRSDRFATARRSDGARLATLSRSRSRRRFRLLPCRRRNL